MKVFSKVTLLASLVVGTLLTQPAIAGGSSKGVAVTIPRSSQALRNAYIRSSNEQTSTASEPAVDGQSFTTFRLPELTQKKSHVLACERKPDIMGAEIADAVGRPHKWLVVKDGLGNTIHAAGLGNKRGVPGANGQSSPDWPLSKSFIRDHSTENPRSCVAVPNADPSCVVSKSPLGKYEGRWVPFYNDCNKFVDRTVESCQLPHVSPRQASLPGPRIPSDPFSNW